MIGLQGPSYIIENDETLCVTRIGTVIYQDGKPIDRNLIEFNITCNIQPLNGRDLTLVPEGDRYKEQYWIWMNNSESPLEINDKVCRKGLDKTNRPALVKFQVQEVQHWGSYTRARIMRLDVGAEKTP